MTNIVFEVFTYQLVYSPQFPTHGSNWLNSTVMGLRTKPTGVVVDLDTPTTGQNRIPKVLKTDTKWYETARMVN